MVVIGWGDGVAEQYRDLKLLLKQLANREPKYRLYRRYYDGDHDLLSVGPEYLAQFREILESTRYNRCATIVDTLADKLQVTGFINESDDKVQNADIAKVTQQIWRRNRMDRRSGEVHLEQFMCGDAYAIVWPNTANQAVIYPQRADRCMVRYSEEDLTIETALKLWRLADGRWRANLYYRDRVEKYVSTAKTSSMPTTGWAWAPFKDEDAGRWPLLYSWGEGMPVFHFANNARSGQMGQSELRDIVPLQDVLNKSLSNQVVAGEFASFPQRYVIGLAMEKELDANGVATGKYINPFKNIPGQLWWLGPGDADDSQASFGEFRVGDVTQFIREQESIDRQIANVARIPVHYLGMTGDFPSGESLKTADTPLTLKTEDRQIATGNGWEDVASFCLLVEASKPLDTLLLSTQWKPAEPRSDVDFWTVAAMKINAGVPEEEIWREYGYPEDKIAIWLQAKQQREAQAAAQMEQLRRSLNDQPPADEEADAESDDIQAMAAD